MTDTGQVPGQGQPENAGGHRGQPPAVPTPADAGPTQHPGDYPYLGPADGTVEDDDLLMPGTQGAWSEQGAQQPPPAQPLPQPQAVPPQQTAPFDPAAGYAPAGDHETGGRDSGSVDLGAVRAPQPTVPPQARAHAAAAPRRPLHMGPPVPEATGGVVRSLADRGPAAAPQQAARQPAPPAGAPEYLDVPAETPQAVPLPDEQPDAAQANVAQTNTAPSNVAQTNAAQPVEPQPTGVQPADDGAAAAQTQAAPAQPHPEGVPAAAAQQEQQPAAVPYGQRPYEGQTYAEQSYGAAGQGPLPGPQLGEIPSHTPAQAQPWGETSTQGAATPVAEPTAGPAAPVAGTGGAETVAPEAQPPAQEGGLPAEQPPAALSAEQAPADQAPAGQQPQPVATTAEGAAPAEDGTAAPVVAQPGENAQEAAAQAPAQPQNQAPAPENAAEQPQGATAAAPEATTVATAAAPAPEAAAQQTAPEQAVAPDAAAPQPAADAPAAAQAVPEAAPQQPEAPAPEDAPATPEAAAPQPEPAEAPVEAAQAPQDAAQPAAAQPAGQPAPDAPAQAPTTDQPRAEAAAPQPAPEAPTEPAPAAPAAQPEQPAAEEQATEPQPVETAEVAAPAAEVVPAEGATAPEAEPAAQAADAPPAPEEAPQQPVIEAETQPQDTGAPQQAAAPEDAAAPQPAPEAEAPQPAPEDEQPAPAAESAEDPAPQAADAPAGQEPGPAEEAPVQPEAAAPQIPAQETAEPVPAPQEPAADQAPQAPAAATDAVPAGPAPAEADALPHQQDDAQFVEHAEGDEAHPAEAPAAAPATAPAPGYDDDERAAVHRVIRERRDIRNGFRPDPIPNDVLLRVLEAAHTAPSVGHSQPWDFVVIRSDDTRAKMHELAMRQRDAYAKSLPKARAKQFRELKIEAILETPVNIVVTADPTRGGRHTLGRHTQPQMAPYSSALAVENLWLAARAEGLGVGWVSFFDEREMVRELGLPEHLEIVAYLCVGYVDEFPDEPELLQAGWSKRRPLSWVVHEETYGRRALPGEDPHDLLQETLAGIRPLDAKALGEAWERQKRMTKPAGALGMLEIISAQLCGLSRKCPPPIPEPAAVAIFAGDHGVHAQGVTPWPQEVTGQMVANFLGGGAVCNAFANQVGAEVCVVDVGVAGDLPSTPGLLPRKVRPGTADFTQGPAMTQDEALKAIEVGIETARDLVAAGNKALLTGEMGIANTTSSAALIAVYTGVDPAEVTGRGTGINDETHARKVEVVRRALEFHQPDPADPITVLAALGGLEHAAMIGLILGGASLRTPVILDGVSAGAAALVARAIAPEALAACIAGHRSAEPGHVAALNKLGLRPLVDLDLRLGEGTGALLALPVVQSAARAMHEVATFDSAGVTEKS
ncbi:MULTISPECIES: nicotinate-nucleotide--dimethylbenzimidazole phosphoribosyltransferase [unclassified Streptomyces]|uniref:nicotinate-nucleotide--dimethylbenzimidazole phosphoribosyltransferase n=1 Tax=unclassified Streptomyces TaxID=2593676 RepID=UPI0003827F10|nr:MULTISPECIES: nicotinate-nucleotide--dimethylbenzimidazole phosphoribosyltransferase [unclassified Streptomyces]MYT29086.1 nicotinate-nucleotide--dimethylbenzimidazole phosphoribosyltransferase [Streptomyces sp. SID8354]